MGSLDPDFTTDNRLGVWALTDREKVSQGGVPKLSSVVIGSETYGVPPAAPQKGSSSTIDSGDDRMQQVQFIDGSLWGALDTVLTPQGDSTQRAGAAWFEVTPQLKNKKISGAISPRKAMSPRVAITCSTQRSSPMGRAARPSS